MKSNHLASLAFGALLLGSTIVSAQSTETPKPQDTTKGNEVVGNPQPPPANPLSSPQTAGQDKATGNNMVGANTGQALASADHPGFDALDTGKKSYLNKHDVKSHMWLSKNFAKCDADHDGHLSQDEYAACHK
jgi:hypothetical protein